MKKPTRLKTTIDVKKRRDIFEPMHCERRGCREKLNGLNYHFLDFGIGYIFGIWLCDGCSKSFLRLGGRRKLTR